MSMTSPRPMSGVFVSNIPEPKKRRPKAPNSCYPSQARGREEVSRSFCASPGASFPVRRRSPGRGTSPEPPVPQVMRRSSASPEPPMPQIARRSSANMNTLACMRHRAQSPGAPTSPLMANASDSRIPRPTRRSVHNESNNEAAKTITAIDGALRAVEAALTNTKLSSGDCSPSANEDVESLCGTECTESTACSSTLSEDSTPGSRRMSFSLESARTTLRDARRSQKERIGAEERSRWFNNGLLAKLDELRDAVVDDRAQAKTR